MGRFDINNPLPEEYAARLAIPGGFTVDTITKVLGEYGQNALKVGQILQSHGQSVRLFREPSSRRCYDQLRTFPDMEGSPLRPLQIVLDGEIYNLNNVRGRISGGTLVRRMSKREREKLKIGDNTLTVVAWPDDPLYKQRIYDLHATHLLMWACDSKQRFLLPDAPILREGMDAISGLEAYMRTISDYQRIYRMSDYQRIYRMISALLSDGGFERFYGTKPSADIQELIRRGLTLPDVCYGSS